MLEAMPSSLFAEWMAFHNLDPFGEERADLRSAIIAMIIANQWRSKGQRPYNVEDFMPFFEKPQKTLEDVESMLHGIFGTGQ